MSRNFVLKIYDEFSDFDITLRYGTVEKCREMSRNVEKCREMLGFVKFSQSRCWAGGFQTGFDVCY